MYTPETREKHRQYLLNFEQELTSLIYELDFERDKIDSSKFTFKSRVCDHDSRSYLSIAETEINFWGEELIKSYTDAELYMAVFKSAVKFSISSDGNFGVIKIHRRELLNLEIIFDVQNEVDNHIGWIKDFSEGNLEQTAKTVSEFAKNVNRYLKKYGLEIEPLTDLKNFVPEPVRESVNTNAFREHILQKFSQVS
ncbi:MAG: hypothetical protein FWF23_01805 [Alphaproteobacteria bacterium]|nr:hypothetical protein [Alphaproteobacteria bacterium]MCL2505999.1 hypothetical protein [Alphaproteobacteria bacterium]